MIGGWHERAVPAERAVECIHPGARVFVRSACATPRTLLRALEDRAPLSAGAQLVHFLTDGAVAGDASSFRHRVFYVGADVRPLAAGGQVEYVPISVTEVPALVRSGRLPIDVALVQVSPPDGEGMCSLGVSVT